MGVVGGLLADEVLWHFRRSGDQCLTLGVGLQCFLWCGNTCINLFTEGIWCHKSSVLDKVFDHDNCSSGDAGFNPFLFGLSFAVSIDYSKLEALALL